MTRFQLHVQEWDDCQRCELSKRRSNVVHVRGSLPCDVLFVGEAPGKSENTRGIPFDGPAGFKMDEIIAEGLGGVMVGVGAINDHDISDGEPVTYALCNLVGCIPLDENGQKTEEPGAMAIEACSPRLRELIEMASPRVIITVGRLATTWLDTIHLKSVWKIKGASKRDYGIHEGSKIPRVSITHPAAILRAPVVQQGLLTRKAVITIRDAVEAYVTTS